MQVSCKLYFKGSKRYIDIFEKGIQRIHGYFEIDLMFRTTVLVMRLKHGSSFIVAKII